MPRSRLYILFGADFVKRLYKDQKPIISRDGRQAAQFIAQGTEQRENAFSKARDLLGE